MAIGDDFNISVAKEIRHNSGATVYTDLDMHVWLQELADDGSVQTVGDEVFIMTDNPSRIDGPRDAIKPMFLNLINGYNVDATTVEFLNFGSITQSDGNELWTGVKTIGTPLVAGSPIYIVQDNSKLTSYWPNGHIQIMVKAIDGGTAIDSGDVRAFSRKYGQTYSDFAGNLLAGGEQSLAISTQLTDWTPLNLAAALALAPNISIAVGDTNFDTGDPNGSKLYKGTITLSNGATIAEAAQYCQAICDENSVETINGVEGWQYRALDAAYTPNAASPFGAVAGGKWFVERGWLIQGALPADLQNYQMISDDGSTVVNPVLAGITIGDVPAGARVTVGRDDATASGFLDTEYTLDGAVAAIDTDVVINEAVKADTPPAGTIRINEIPHAYSAVNFGTKTFTLVAAAGVAHADNSPTWVPFIDGVSGVGGDVSSANYTHNGDFTARVKVRKGASPNSIQPFETTFSAAASISNGTNVIANPDE